jgi:hypothetical protein
MIEEPLMLKEDVSFALYILIYIMIESNAPKELSSSEKML